MLNRTFLVHFSFGNMQGRLISSITNEVYYSFCYPRASPADQAADGVGGGGGFVVHSFKSKQTDRTSHDTCSRLVMLSRLDFRRFPRNHTVSNGSNGLHRTAFPPFQRISKYSLHFRFHLMTRLPLTQMDLNFRFHLMVSPDH